MQTSKAVVPHTGGEFENLLHEAIKLFSDGLEAWAKFGQAVVGLIEMDGDKARQELKERIPGFNDEHIATFERVGRRQLYAELLISDSPGVRALKRCTYSEQVKYWTDPVELLIFKTTGETDMLKVSVLALSADQAKQVFNKGRLRSLGEQRAWIEGQKLKPHPIANRQPYTVKQGKVIFYEPCTLSVSQLAQLISEASVH